jgi:NAD(P)-dependent dehydrogenase (short-subunit alcohol dehydrogenase family)
VHNSGAAWGEPIETFPDHAWSKVLTLNLQRVFTLTQALLPQLEAAGTATSEGEGPFPDPARVIHIGSIDGLRVPSAAVDNYSYAAAKAGLHHLSRMLAARLGDRGVTSNTVACGPFDTRMTAGILAQYRDEVEGNIPLGRIGTPRDVAGTCLFLASRAG